MRAVLVLAMLALAGCNVILGIEDLSGPAGQADASSPRDASVDVIVPNQIIVTGTVQIFDAQLGSMPGANLSIQFVRLPDRAPLGETVSDPTGNYTIQLVTNGELVDGYFLMRGDPMGTVPTSFVYNNDIPFVGDTNFGLFAFTRTFIEQLAAQVGEPQDPSMAFVLAQVVENVGQIGNSGHAGATVNPELPFRVYYTSQPFFPDPAAMMTGSDGLAFMFNAPMVQTIVRLGGNTTGEGFLDLGFIDGEAGAHYLPFVAQSSP
jgi:hypothetical protein